MQTSLSTAPTTAAAPTTAPPPVAAPAPTTAPAAAPPPVAMPTSRPSASLPPLGPAFVSERESSQAALTGAIVVTGAGSGMGLATARAFVAAGRHVIGLDIAPVALEAPVDATPGAPVAGTPAPAGLASAAISGATMPSAPTLGATTPGSFTSVVGDVRDRAAMESAIASALAPGEPVAAVAAIAGVYPPSTLETYTAEQFRTIFDINVLGVLNTIAAARPHMTAGCSVVTFASVDAYTVSPGQLLYGASKSAVVMLTKSLALELAPAGIRVNGIAPGWVATPGNAATGRMTAAAASVPLGRVAQPDEIARWVLTLTDPALSGFMTGEMVVLSGGDVIR